MDKKEINIMLDPKEFKSKYDTRLKQIHPESFLIDISEEDIDKAITRFSQYSEVEGLIIIKNKRIGLWGKLQLSTF